MKIKISVFILITLLSAPCFRPGSALGANKSGMLNRVMKTVLVMPAAAPSDEEERNDLSGFRTSLSVAGIHFSELPVKQLNSRNLRGCDMIVLPYASAKDLKPAAIESVREAVALGANLVFDGICELAVGFGIKPGKEYISVKQIKDNLFPGIPLYWQKPAMVRPVSEPAGRNCRVLCADEASGAPLAIGSRYGKGNFIYFSTFFDPVSGKGYSRFPFLIEMFSGVFGYVPLAERKISAMYFDPGSRNFMDIEKLAKFWRGHGVQRVYAGAWYFLDDNRYDCERLVRVCHENGILVYCWLELPMVSMKFWNTYPMWREKTATLADAQLDWRYLMNLADPECLRKVLQETGELLRKYDWDGVDLAELYFESTGGPSDPAHLTPMNDIVRKEFRAVNGFDPVEIFNPSSPHYIENDRGSWGKFAEYRKELCNRLKTHLLDFLYGIRLEKKNFEIIITAIDASQMPQLEEYISEDTDYLLSLLRKYPITLQAEDEWMCWIGKPERYDTLGKYYRGFVRDGSRLELDFNVVESHVKGAGGLPAEKPTGEEVRQVVYNIALNVPRPAFYSEDTLYEHDFRNINTVLARDAVITQKRGMQWKIKTPYMVTLHTGDDDVVALLDNEAWFAGQGEEIIVPAGEHILKFKPKARAEHNPRLYYISGELKGARFLYDAIEFSYAEDISSCYAVLSKEPKKIYIDNKRSECAVYSSAGGFSLKLPGGKHTVRVNTGR
jgi:hypothetical protein